MSLNFRRCAGGTSEKTDARIQEPTFAPLSIPAQTYLSKIRFFFPEIPIIIIGSVE